MIDFWTWSTPNGRKVSILLEELELPYRTQAVDITQGEQHDPSFLAVGPNNKIPAIRDNETGMTLMESGAIMIYLAEKTGRFLPEDSEGRHRVFEWLMWQMGGFGPMLGQAHHFLRFNAGKAPYAEERFHQEAQRLYRVLDTRLADRDFVVDDYSIADMAIWPWASRFEWQRIDLNDYPNVKRWYKTIAERPAVQRGYHSPKKVNDIPLP
ncbi:glutathione S-transferase family protein [Aidingimonas lacisalsi]|uniref:glutathione S-transferase family protein n=1 Tax=Aidingimonas lacisalsi TaxID=2604086 RepID=UPI0011D25EFA|nr:glutathione S-transferase N-terminal domain-containing protein [Aidingimonas lacisalsi]